MFCRNMSQNLVGCVLNVVILFFRNRFKETFLLTYKAVWKHIMSCQFYQAAGCNASQAIDSVISDIDEEEPIVNESEGGIKTGMYFVEKLKCNKNYESLKELGSGAFGIVFTAKFIETQEKVAVKTILGKRDTTIDDNTLKEFLLEIDFMASFDHPNIARLIHADKENLCFSLEFAKGGDLYHLVSRQRGLEEKVARHIFQGILNAVSYLHSKLVVHNDIKPENILIMSHSSLPVVKLTDFGSSRRFNDPIKKVSGTLSYCAPEKLEYFCSPLYDRKALTEKLDIYSIGLSLYVSCTYESAFNSNNASGILEEIKKGYLIGFFIPKLNIRFSKGCISFMLNCLTYDRTVRPSAKDLQCHAWFKQKSFY